MTLIGIRMSGPISSRCRFGWTKVNRAWNHDCGRDDWTVLHLQERCVLAGSKDGRLCLVLGFTQLLLCLLYLPVPEYDCQHCSGTQQPGFSHESLLCRSSSALQSTRGSSCRLSASMRCCCSPHKVTMRSTVHPNVRISIADQIARPSTVSTSVSNQAAPSATIDG